MHNMLQIATIDAENNVVEVHDAPAIQEWIEQVSRYDLDSITDTKDLINLLKLIKRQATSYSMAIDGV